MTPPDLVADLQGFGWFAGPAVLILAGIYLHSWWHDRRNKEPEQ